MFLEDGIAPVVKQKLLSCLGRASISTVFICDESPDMMLISFPLYMIWTATLCWERKLFMSIVLSTATFTIIAALINK